MDQLASATHFETVRLPGADVRLAPNWLAQDEADRLMERLLLAIPWERHRITLFGRQIDSPRLSCWIGDPGATYTYSRTRFEPRPWPPALAALRDRLGDELDRRFNSVLANWYRDGRDSMGWHSDDEPELGPAPVIASLSLGQPRTFVFRGRGDAATGARILLPHGSLLVMRGATQALYRHALPSTRRVVAGRINLTFRYVRISGPG